MKNTKKLALLGGEKIRKEKFSVAPMIDEEEKQALLNVVNKQMFSRYVGSLAKKDLYQLALTSTEAEQQLNSEWSFLGGEQVRKFSAEFSRYFNVDYSIPVNSATSGLSVALLAAGVDRGDEVIVPCLSFTASATAILMFGAEPVFVDVDQNTYCIDVAKCEEKISKKTKAILCVHLLGNACAMDEIVALANKYSLKIIEDCAQSPGVKYKNKYLGTYGDVGVFSFQESKNIMTGEGGMIVTNDAQIAKKSRMIINHGECLDHEFLISEGLHNIPGYNFRMTEMSAALGVVQLHKLSKVNEWRNNNYSYLISNLEKFDFLTPQLVEDKTSYVCHVASLSYDKEKFFDISRSLFIKALECEGISVGTGYTRLMSDNPIFISQPDLINYDDRPVEFKVASDLINNKLLWFYHIAYPSTVDDMKDIVTAIEKVVMNAEFLDRELSDDDNQEVKRQGRII